MRGSRRWLKLVVGAAIGGLLCAGFALPVVGAVGALAQQAVGAFQGLPSTLLTPPLPQSSRILAADGSTLARFYVEDRRSMPLDQISKHMQDALISTEDARFREHGAIDLQGSVRAAIVDLRGGTTSQGGSTLTQQYVKNVLVQAGDPGATDDTLSRKLHEARLAIALEKRLTKSEILQRYLNIVYFGEGAYGAQAAAERYFSVPASKLTVAQSAVLAGLVQSPETFDPIRHPQAAKRRRAHVLDRMVATGDLSDAERRAIERQPLGLHPKPPHASCTGSVAPLFCDLVRRELLADPRLGSSRSERESKLLKGGLVVQTAMDPKVQRAATFAARHYLSKANRVAAAIAMVQPGTGRVLALASSRPYGSRAKRHETRLNLALGGASGFQAGSTFKMFVLAAALQKHTSLRLTLHAPVQMTFRGGFRGCKGQDLGRWKVHNAGAHEAGTFSLVRATWESVNTYFAQLEHRIGVCGPWRLATKMGVRNVATGKAVPEVPTFTLGVADTSPLQMAAAYASLAARGRYCAPHAVLSVRDRQGHTISTHADTCHRVLPVHVADSVTSVLRGVIDGPDPLRTGAGASIGRPAAGKTGTTDSEAAAWFTGYTPHLAGSVWVGDPRGGARHPLKNVTSRGHRYGVVYGGDIPARIWRLAMRRALGKQHAVNFRGAGAHVAGDRPQRPSHGQTATRGPAHRRSTARQPARRPAPRPSKKKKPAPAPKAAAAKPEVSPTGKPTPTRTASSTGSGGSSPAPSSSPSPSG